MPTLFAAFAATDTARKRCRNIQFNPIEIPVSFYGMYRNASYDLGYKDYTGNLSNWLMTLLG